ncbi:hypothetical protein L210DRAFT_927739 [Boletus edulis BED1]|uniref:DASH complex subunit ASK1 n=1 Tax=Boletus edulis BED1 TaxID=1328754 RepID=A0AAD4BP67_BOLED|nr:hypothetical protein L210DRAFT_927739 [Boletus edulis BED1]
MTTPIEPNPPRWSPSTDPASIVVPGLDTNAPINDQIDQIEQLITIKLQNIDANFSKIQHLMATRLLPAVKRYALGTEPVREAAKFWTSFYEQAAQVHIPTLEDDDLVYDEQTQSSVVTSEPASVAQPEENLDVTPSRTPPTRTYDVTASESSFMPANAVSSTPARPGHAHAPDRTLDDQPSWSASLESPMDRLKSELQSFAREEEEASAQQDVSSLTDSLMYEEENTIQQLPPMAQEKTEKSASRFGRDEPKAKIQFSHIPPSALPTPRANVTNAYISPLKVKPKTPIVIPKHIQSILPAKLENEPTFSSPCRPRFERTPRKPTTASSSASASTSTSASASVLDIPSLTKHVSDSNQGPKFTTFDDSFDDSVDLMQGMSPPRTLAFARAPRSSVGLGLLPPLGRTPGRDLLPTLGRTPGKEAADRIRRDLLGDMQSQFKSVNSAASNKMRTPAFGYGTGTNKDDTMSTIPTPPSLSRYTRHAYPSWTDSNDTDTSLATMMRRVGLEMPESSFKADSVASASHSRASFQVDAGSSVIAPPTGEDEPRVPDYQELDTIDFHQDDQSTIQLGSHPHDADSDSDSDSDSLNDEPVHPNQPSTAFLMASSRELGPDDSFGSSNSNHSSDSLDADELGAGDEAAVHPFARALEAGVGEGDGFDDSFDSESGYEGQGEDASAATEETVFGIPPARRGQQGREPGQLKLLGEDLLQDTIGIGGQLAKTGRIEESPTPYGRG